MEIIWRVGLIVFVLFASSGLDAQERLAITIQRPGNGSGVDQRHEVGGKVTNANAEVWVVIRPIETSEFWVQPPVTVNEDGSWKVIAYFGEAGARHLGKKFEVRAFANPVGKFVEGKISQWPKAAARSNVIEVMRR